MNDMMGGIDRKYFRKIGLGLDLDLSSVVRMQAIEYFEVVSASVIVAEYFVTVRRHCSLKG